MAMIPSGFFGEISFSANDISSSNFRNQFNTTDPFSFTMYWQETVFVITANVQGFRSEDVKVEINGRNLVLKLGGSDQNCGCIKSCKLPNNVNMRMTTTSINNGVLLVKVPTLMQHEEPKKQINNPPVVVSQVYRRRRRSFFC
ncbi:17.8 kDa class I heat shock protein-like [Mercurialis annua]|uniref:17.8 kDa class I heat shock protein-like n=1 Tax=Mercurialis annua TaxID=3986 RepID=UPI00215DD5D8|nr:17.8 kDa class I heat shock protein-like [Mercurialis annua]